MAGGGGGGGCVGVRVLLKTAVVRAFARVTMGRRIDPPRLV